MFAFSFIVVACCNDIFYNSEITLFFVEFESVYNPKQCILLKIGRRFGFASNNTYNEHHADLCENTHRKDDYS